MIIRESI